MAQGRGGEEEFESLYLTLLSNGGGPQFHDTNKNNDYKVKLPYRLRLPGNGWQVALSSITLPRPTVPVNLHKDNLAKKIPGDSPLASVLIFLYNDVTPVYRRSKWVTMDEVLKHDSVYDGVTFMKRLKLLLERNMYRLFYKHGSESEYTLRRTKWQGGRDTGIRGYPLFNWNEKEDVLEVDWSGTDDDNQRAHREVTGNTYSRENRLRRETDIYREPQTKRQKLITDAYARPVPPYRPSYGGGGGKRIEPKVQQLRDTHFERAEEESKARKNSSRKKSDKLTEQGMPTVAIDVQVLYPCGTGCHIDTHRTELFFFLFSTQTTDDAGRMS